MHVLKMCRQTHDRAALSTSYVFATAMLRMLDFWSVCTIRCLESARKLGMKSQSDQACRQGASGGKCGSVHTKQVRWFGVQPRQSTSSCFCSHHVFNHLRMSLLLCCCSFLLRTNVHRPLPIVMSHDSGKTIPNEVNSMINVFGFLSQLKRTVEEFSGFPFTSFWMHKRIEISPSPAKTQTQTSFERKTWQTRLANKALVMQQCELTQSTGDALMLILRNILCCRPGPPPAVQPFEHFECVGMVKRGSKTEIHFSTPTTGLIALQRFLELQLSS
jgi:hypothetical protein